MNELIEPESLLNFNVEATESEENSTYNRSISENVIVGEETGAEVTQEEADQTINTPPGEPSRVSLNTEDVGQTGEIGTSQGKDTALVEQNLDEKPISLRVETISGTVVPSEKKKNKIKTLRKEQQRLQKLVKTPRQNIGTLIRGKVSGRTPKIMNATIQNEFHDTKVTGTHTEPILTQIVKEQHVIVVEATGQTESVHFCNLAIQTEVVPSDNMAT